MGRKSSNKRRARETGTPGEEEDKRQGYVVVGLIAIATTLGIWGTIINDEMLIPGKTIWLTALAGALIATPIFYLIWRSFLGRWELGRVWVVAITLFYGIIIGGPIAYFSINAINYYIKGDGITETVTLDVIDTGRSSKRRSKECSHINVEVKLKDIQYTIPFSCEYEYTISDYKKVDLTLTKGGLGYYMIVDKSLVGIEE